MKRAEPLKRTGGLSRGSGPRRRPKQPMSSGERADAATFHRQITRAATCLLCPATILLDAHHLLPKERLKRLGYGSRIWDVRLGVPLCPECHERVTNRRVYLTRKIIGRRRWAAFWAWVQECGLESMAGREYPT